MGDGFGGIGSILFGGASKGGIVGCTQKEPQGYFPPDVDGGKKPVDASVAQGDGNADVPIFEVYTLPDIKYVNDGSTGSETNIINPNETVEAETVSPSSKGVRFCNLPVLLTTNIPLIPICIQPTKEYQYVNFEPGSQPEISVAGKTFPLYEKCGGNYTSGGYFWADVELSSGPNPILAKITFQNKDVQIVQAEVTYDPNYSTKNQALIYGVSSEQIMVVDPDSGLILGKIKSPLPGFGPKNLVVSNSYDALYSPREAGIDVVKTATNQIVATVLSETGGHAALNGNGNYLFVNRYTKDLGSSDYLTNVYDTETWKLAFSFKGGGPDYGLLLLPQKMDKLYMSSYYIDVYLPPEYTTKSYIQNATGPLHDYSPEAGYVVSGSFNIVDVDTDTVVYSFSPKISSVYDAVFSPDGKVVYLGGLSQTMAHEFATKATLWVNDADANKLVISPDGTRLYSYSSPNPCGTDYFITDTETGKIISQIPLIPFTGDLVYKPAN